MEWNVEREKLYINLFPTLLKHLSGVFFSNFTFFLFFFLSAAFPTLYFLFPVRKELVKKCHIFCSHNFLYLYLIDFNFINTEMEILNSLKWKYI